jgi:hypothetical protein
MKWGRVFKKGKETDTFLAEKRRGGGSVYCTVELKGEGWESAKKERRNRKFLSQATILSF